jgi:hypothetical protein
MAERCGKKNKLFFLSIFICILCWSLSIRLEVNKFIITVDTFGLFVCVECKQLKYSPLQKLNILEETVMYLHGMNIRERAQINLLKPSGNFTYHQVKN